MLGWLSTVQLHQTTDCRGTVICWSRAVCYCKRCQWGYLVEESPSLFRLHGWTSNNHRQLSEQCREPSAWGRQNTPPRDQGSVASRPSLWWSVGDEMDPRTTKSSRSRNQSASKEKDPRGVQNGGDWTIEWLSWSQVNHCWKSPSELGRNSHWKAFGIGDVGQPSARYPRHRACSARSHNEHLDHGVIALRIFDPVGACVVRNLGAVLPLWKEASPKDPDETHPFQGKGFNQNSLEEGLSCAEELHDRARMASMPILYRGLVTTKGWLARARMWKGLCQLAERVLGEIPCIDCWDYSSRGGVLGFAITWHVPTPAALFQPQGIGHWTIPSDSLALQGKRSPIRTGSYRQLLH